MAWMNATKFGVYAATDGIDPNNGVALLQNGEQIVMSPKAIRRFVQEAIRRGYISKRKIRKALRQKARQRRARPDNG